MEHEKRRRSAAHRNARQARRARVLLVCDPSRALPQQFRSDKQGETHLDDAAWKQRPHPSRKNGGPILLSHPLPPCSAQSKHERRACQQSGNDGPCGHPTRPSRRPLPSAARDSGEQHRSEYETDQIPACRSGDDAQPRGALGKHRQAKDAHQEVQHHRHACPKGSQDQAREIHEKALQSDGHLRQRNGNPRSDAGQRGQQSGEGGTREDDVACTSGNARKWTKALESYSFFTFSKAARSKS